MYDVAVIGAGHAGIEAAMAAARMGAKVLLVSSNLDMCGSMPCNPSVGGPAKGIVVREIDALGGVMPQAADTTALQFKMLNTAKGPGVRSLRVQSDKEAYKRYMRKALEEQPNLELLEAQAKELIIEEHTVKGLVCEDGQRIDAKTVILTSGTYLSACVLKGHTSTPSGPDGQKTNTSLSKSLEQAGLKLIRLKTGTPPRVARDSVDLGKASLQPGDRKITRFCQGSDPDAVPAAAGQQDCYLIYTTPKTHEIIRSHLQDSAMYSGLVTGVGPRYCPSIEDKLVRFADKERHQLFLEPESLDYDTLYIQGFSTSMPEDVQEDMVHSLPGLEQAKILKYAYAIEYDAVDPLQMKPSLENKIIKNLYTAGQINGTSGYEEAAGQGLLAGANAVLALRGQEPLVLGRDEAYMGVMVDDLVTKGTKEPYRLLTSRAEYRLLLRHDNAADRLMEKGWKAGLVSDEIWQAFCRRKEQEAKALEFLKSFHISPNGEIAQILESHGLEPLQQGCSAYDLLKRPGITLSMLEGMTGRLLDEESANRLEIEIKYEGYIRKARRDTERMKKMESVKIPEGLDYTNLDNLALEARQKLQQVQPATLGQASRISGINPADIAVLSAWIRHFEKQQAQSAA